MRDWTQIIPDCVRVLGKQHVPNKALERTGLNWAVLAGVTAPAAQGGRSASRRGAYDHRMQRMWAIGTLIAALSVSVAACATDIPIGTFSVYMASASGNQHVKFGWLLPCGDHGYVSIIDSSTNDVVRTIEVGSCPFQVAADPKRPRIYVVHGAPYDPVTFVTQGPGSVWMVDVRNGSVIASLSVGYAPTSIALTSDGEKAYVTNWESDAVSVIDTDAFTVLKTISIEKPTSVAHSPSTPTAYVTSTNGTVTMLDTLTDTATATILVAATAESISVSTDGSIGYVSGAAPSDDAPLTVFELDLAAGRVLDEIRDDADTMYTGFIAMSPDGLFGYSAGDDGTPPTVFDIGRRVFELFDCPKCFLVWKGSGSIAVSPDSATVFTGGWVFDARSRRAVARVDLPAGATGVAVGPSWPITHLEKDRDGCHIHPGTPPNQWMLLPAIACGIAKLLGSRRRESRTKVFQPTPKSGAAENWRSAHPAPLSAGHGGHGMSVIYFHDLGHAFTMFARAGIGSVFALGLISGTALGSDPLSAESVPTLTSTPVEAKRLLCVRLVPGLPADVRREDDGRLSMVLWFRVTNDIHRCDAGTYESPYQIAPVVALDSAPEGVELGAPVQVCRPAVEIRYSGYYGWCLRYPPSLQGTEVVVQARVEGWVHPGGYDSYEASFQVVLPDLLDTATPTPTQTPVVCAGDCDGDARVSIAELMRGVEIGLGVIALADCPPFDLDKDGRVTVDELINATNRALEGCAR